MLTKLIEHGTEVVANVIVFVLAVALSTGLTCGSKVPCDDCSRDQAAKVAAP